jgi:GNAT superfamily N-acetyltransferase
MQYSSSESIEHQAFEAWFRAAMALDEGKFRWTRFRQGDAVCYGSSTEPSILVNRVLGLGAEYPPTLEQLVDIREIYKNAGIGRFFLHVIPDELQPDYADLLAAAGYEKYRGWMKFVRGTEDADPASTDLTITRIGSENAAEFASIVGNAFDFRPTFQPAIAALANDPDWRLYMSFSGETPAGTGGLYVKDGVGYLDFGATHPDFRKRGGQTGVLNTRIRAALEAGCTSIVTMTGEAVPGDEQHSYRNIKRAGFNEAYLRENWIPAGS